MAVHYYTFGVFRQSHVPKFQPSVGNGHQRLGASDRRVMTVMAAM